MLLKRASIYSSIGIMKAGVKINAQETHFISSKAAIFYHLASIIRSIHRKWITVEEAGDQAAIA
jgi:hypothetical protein